MTVDPRIRTAQSVAVGAARSAVSMEHRDDQKQHCLHEAAMPPIFSLELSALARRSQAGVSLMALHLNERLSAIRISPVLLIISRSEVKP